MIIVTRTGNVYSIASCEFLVTFPDGTQETIWSPPWNEYYDDDEEMLHAKEFAEKLWQERSGFSSMEEQ